MSEPCWELLRLRAISERSTVGELVEKAAKFYLMSTRDVVADTRVQPDGRTLAEKRAAGETTEIPYRAELTYDADSSSQAPPRKADAIGVSGIVGAAAD